MTILAICLLIGVGLGLRFKVFILIPITGVTLALVAINGVVVGHGILRIVGSMVLTAIALQLGYLGGGLPRLVAFTKREHHSARGPAPPAPVGLRPPAGGRLSGASGGVPSDERAGLKPADGGLRYAVGSREAG
jgi:hypothetical protein